MAERSPDQLQPRRTWFSNTVKSLPGGTEDNDLWVLEAGGTISSTFVPTDEQRKAIAEGANLELTIWSPVQPPVAMDLTDVPIGKPPDIPERCEGCAHDDCDEVGSAFVLTRHDGWLPVCLGHAELEHSAGSLVKPKRASDG